MASKRILAAALLSTCMASPALAGPWTVGPQTITYTNTHPLGGRNSAPAYAYEEPDVSSGFTENLWTHDTGDGTTAVGGQYDGPGVGSEAKFRADCNIAFENHNDPILAPGIANGATHDHSFFGNVAAATNTHLVTYASLRAAGNSTCWGGPLNRTLYWEPSMKKVLSNGITVSVKPKNITTYYEGGDLAEFNTGRIGDPAVFARWPRGIKFIEGVNMSDPGGTRYATILAAANAGQPGRYSLVLGATSGFRGWSCLTPAAGAGPGGRIATSPLPASDFQPYLKNANGTPTLDCAPNTLIMAEIASDPCWDGVNLDSPDGRLHMMPFLRDSNTGKNVCPDNWFRVVTFRAKVQFMTKSQSDHTNWWAASDRMAGMTQFLNGESMHFDLIPAWSYGTGASPGTFLRFAVHCNGQTVTVAGTTINGDPHECGSGRFDSASQLYNNEASPDGSAPNPIVTLNPDHSGIDRYFLPATGTSVPGTVSHTH